ncbi:MAG: hypothetical protein K1X64_11580 [Myxococcaceae bacterium]|nr:hypothetical protein [Myxococcaceae bacterium]
MPVFQKFTTGRIVLPQEPNALRPPAKPPRLNRPPGIVQPPKPPLYTRPQYDVLIDSRPGVTPTLDDVTVRKGFDGLTPDEVVKKVLSLNQTPVHQSNRRFIERHIKEQHRAFTVGVSNAFVWGSPSNKVLAGLGVNEFKALGTLQGSQAVVFEVRRPDQINATYYAFNDAGQFAQAAAPTMPIVMEAAIRLKPAGVAIDYPGWRAPVLSGPTVTIEEP